MNTVVIRSIVAGDAAAVDAAAHSSAVQHYAENPRLFAPPADKAGSWSAELLREQADAHVFVAERDGRVVGYTHVTVNRESRALFNLATFGKIESVAVLTAFQGRGIGTALLRQAQAWARERGCREVRLNVWLFNERAANLYRRLGFTPMSMFMAKPLE